MDWEKWQDRQYAKAEQLRDDEFLNPALKRNDENPKHKGTANDDEELPK